jgi:simple sugar transport system permease protein
VRHDASGNIVPVFILVQVTCVVAWLLFPESFRYLDWTNVESMMRAIPPVGIVAIGAGILMICGEFDLSVGATFVLTPFLMAQALLAGLPLPVAIVICLAAATAIGLSNGLITVAFRIPSFITTLGSMMFLRGVVRFVSDNKGVRFDLGEVADGVLTGTVGFAQMQVIWFILFVFAGYLLLVRHRLGNHIFMVGGNPRAAVAVGINANRVKVICFVLSALCACFAGIMSAARVGAITPTGSVGLELQAIAICVVGGLSLRGGRGTIVGIVLGAVLFFTIQDVLLLLRAPGFYLDMFVGAVIVLAVILNQSRRGRV